MHPAISLKVIKVLIIKKLAIRKQGGVVAIMLKIITFCTVGMIKNLFLKKMARMCAR